MKKKKIAFFTYQMLEYGGGVAKYYLEIAPELQRRLPNNIITIVTFTDAFYRKLLFFYTIYFWGNQDQHTIVSEPTHVIKNKLKNVNYVKVNSLSELAAFIYDQDIFYTTNNLLELLLLKLFSFRHKLPKVIIVFHIPIVFTMPTSIHNYFHNLIYTSFLYRLLISPKWTLHVLNVNTKTFLSRYFISKNIKLIYTPYKFPNKINVQRKNTQRYALLWIGRITEQKGIIYLEKIINAVNLRIQDKITWTIIGDGDLRMHIESLAKKWSNIRYHGYIKNDKLPTIYANHNLFIMTSISEGYPYTMLEAQSMGLPIISFDIPGCQDIVINNKTGYLVKNTHEYIEKIIYYVTEKLSLNIVLGDTYNNRWEQLEKIFHV